MFIFKNAWISIVRNKSRNILIGVIILVIACASTITLAIKNTAGDLINSYKDSYDKELTISFNRKEMMKDFDFSNQEKREEMKDNFSNMETYNVDDIKKYADSDYIEDYYYTYQVSLNADGIEKAESDSNFGEMGRGKHEDENQLDFSLMGYSSKASMTEFIEGKYKMTEIVDDAWDKAFDGNYIFINKELASLNNLKLNDKITFKSSDNQSYEFEILGIFEESESDDSKGNGPMGMFSNSANTVITNTEALTKISEKNENVHGMITPTFVIKDYNDAEKIEKEFHNKGLPDNYTVETNEEEASQAVSSVSNVNTFATTFLVITLIIGSVVLFVINMINIRERKYEIGVLRTIGISKLKLTLQFLLELSIVAVASLVVGLGIGAFCSKGVSNALLQNEISSSTEQNEKIDDNFGGKGGPGMGENNPGEKGFQGGREKGLKGIPTIQAYDSIDAVVNIKVTIELLGIGLTIVLISSIASMISIERFSPLTILKERS